MYSNIFAVGLHLHVINLMMLETTICNQCVNRQHTQILFLRSIFTRKSPKYINPTFVKAFKATSGSQGRSAVTGIIDCALHILQLTHLLLSHLRAFRTPRIHICCLTRFLTCSVPRADCPCARFARLILSHDVSKVAELDACY